MLLRLLRLLILSSPVVLLTIWFSDNPGSLVVDWLGWHIETGMPTFLLAVLVLFAAWSGLEAGVAFLMGLPKRLTASRKVKAQGQGMGALLGALDAVAAGKSQEVARLGAEAARLLDAPGLPDRLAALRLEMKAQESPVVHKPLEAKPKSKPVVPVAPVAAKKQGWWGRRGAPLSRAASIPVPLVVDPPAPAPVTLAVPPPVTEDPIPVIAAFNELASSGEWGQAAGVMDAAVADGRITKVAAAPWQALALTAQAYGADAAGDPDKSLALAQDAMVARPGFLPAVLQGARLLVAAGRNAEAETIVNEAWSVEPSSPLAAAWISLGNNKPSLARVEALVSHKTEDHPDSQLALGEAAVAEEQWGRARRHLVAVAKIRTDKDACRLMAVIEERDRGDAAAVEMWRRKESGAAAKGWHCNSCGKAIEGWGPTCPSCHGIGTTEWSAYRPTNVTTA